VPQCDTYSVVHPHGLFEVVVGVQVVVGVRILASDAAVNSKAQHSGSDRGPLGLGHGHSQLVKGENVGSHDLGSVDLAIVQGMATIRCPRVTVLRLAPSRTVRS